MRSVKPLSFRTRTEYSQSCSCPARPRALWHQARRRSPALPGTDFTNARTSASSFARAASAAAKSAFSSGASAAQMAQRSCRFSFRGSGRHTWLM